MQTLPDALVRAFRAFLAFLAVTVAPALAQAQVYSDRSGYGRRGGSWLWIALAVLAILFLFGGIGRRRRVPPGTRP